MSKNKYQKLPPAKVTAMVDRLNKAGIEAWMTHSEYAAFGRGVIGLPPGMTIPMIAFDFRAGPAEVAQVMAAPYGVGSWAIMAKFLGGAL